VGAEDVGSGEDGGYVGGGGGVEAVFHGGRASVEKCCEGGVLGEGMGKEAFAGRPRHDGQVELAKHVEVGQEWVIFVEFFAKT